MDNLLSRITIDPAICHGKPCVRGLRYPVEMLLDLMSSGMTTDQIEQQLMQPSSAENLRTAYAAAYAEVKRLISVEGEKRVWQRVAS